MPDRKLMADEVELHIEHRIPVWHCAGGQSAWTHIQRHLPPVIYQRHMNHADLADDLGPHMQGVAGGRPFVHHQGWPVVRCVLSTAAETDRLRPRSGQYSVAVDNSLAIAGSRATARAVRRC